MRGDSYQLQGQQGGTVLEAGQGKTTPTRWIQVVNDAVLTTITGNMGNVSALQDIELPAGLGFGFEIETILVTSGVIIAFDK